MFQHWMFQGTWRWDVMGHEEEDPEDAEMDVMWNAEEETDDIDSEQKPMIIQEASQQKKIVSVVE